MFENPTVLAVLFAFCAAAITTVGLVCVWLNAQWTRANSGLFAAFAAGALICVVLLHLAPEALQMNANASLWMLGGFFFGFLLNRGVLALGRNGVAAAAGITPALAIAGHSFVDGVVYAVNFSVSAETGVLTAIGLILHEAPEGVIVFTLLQRAGIETKKALLFAFIAAGLTTPLGAIAATPIVASISEDALGALFATTSGLLLYIAAAHLIPHVEREPFRRAVPALALGVAVAVGASFTHAPHHDEGHGQGYGPGHGHGHGHGHFGQDHDHLDHDHMDHSDPHHDHSGLALRRFGSQTLQSIN